MLIANATSAQVAKAIAAFAIAAVPADVEVFHVEQLEVPGLSAERCLVWMRPKLRYPPGSSDGA